MCPVGTPPPDRFQGKLSGDRLEGLRLDASFDPHATSPDEFHVVLRMDDQRLTLHVSTLSGREVVDVVLPWPSS